MQVQTHMKTFHEKSFHRLTLKWTSEFTLSFHEEAKIAISNGYKKKIIRRYKSVTSVEKVKSFF